MGEKLNYIITVSAPVSRFEERRSLGRPTVAEQTCHTVTDRLQGVHGNRAKVGHRGARGGYLTHLVQVKSHFTTPDQFYELHWSNNGYLSELFLRSSDGRPKKKD